MANHYPRLNPEKVLTRRISDRDVTPWIPDNALRCGHDAHDQKEPA